jgi:hypothetical protein
MDINASSLFKYMFYLNIQNISLQLVREIYIQQYISTKSNAFLLEDVEGVLHKEGCGHFFFALLIWLLRFREQPLGLT